MDPTKKQTLAVFNHLKAQKANKVGHVRVATLARGRKAWVMRLRLRISQVSALSRLPALCLVA